MSLHVHHLAFTDAPISKKICVQIIKTGNYLIGEFAISPSSFDFVILWLPFATVKNLTPDQFFVKDTWKRFFKYNHRAIKIYSI